MASNLDIEKEFQVISDYIAIKIFNNKYVLLLEGEENEDAIPFNRKTLVSITVYHYADTAKQIYKYNRGYPLNDSELKAIGINHTNGLRYDVYMVLDFVSNLKAACKGGSYSDRAKGSICGKCKRFDDYASPSNKHNGEIRCYICFEKD